MRFELTADQQDFATSLESLLSGADTVAAARSWAAGDHPAGLKLWQRLAEQGVTMLATEATAVEVCVAFEALGRHAVPGPWVESAAYLPVALGREIEGMGTVAMPAEVALALDADVADEVYAMMPEGLAEATVGELRVSVDRSRRLFEVSPEVSRLVAGAPRASTTGDDAAYDLAVLATAAQLLGAGERVLADSVTYVRQRKQFGREIGSYQAIKHKLADVRIALDFARPLVFGAALETTARSVSAAKVACGDAAYLAARAGLQVHGAIGYTQEFDLSLWLTKIRALQSAWGTSAEHRARILASLVGPSTGSGTGS